MTATTQAKFNKYVATNQDTLTYFQAANIAYEHGLSLEDALDAAYGTN